MSHRLEGMGQEKYKGLTVLNNGRRVFNGKISFDEEALSIPLKRRKPTTYFVNSMSDLFHKDAPFEFIDRVFAVMALCPQHTFQVLTKRPERMAEYMNNPDAVSDNWQDRLAPLMNVLQGISGRAPRSAFRWPLPNVWLGMSCENQEAANRRIPELLKCPAHVRFISAEPLLGDLRITPYLSNNYRTRAPGSLAADLPAVIAGGESGSGARPCNIEWIRSIVAQCKAAGVPCFVKQLGKWIAGPAPGDGGSMSVPRWLLRDANGNECTLVPPLFRSQFGSPELYDRPKNAVAWGLEDPKGGTIEEWPADLRVREMPGVSRG
jgi:protein gp37